jgi:hypothetical protein
VIVVRVNQNPVEPKKKEKKKKNQNQNQKTKKTWPSAPSAAKNKPISPALAPRSQSGVAGAEYRGT